MKPRVALVCAGVGVADRGFERVTRELFDAVCDQVDVTLFKGGGAREPRERPLPVPNRRLRPLRALGRQRALQIELALFAARLLPHLARGGYPVVHYIEPYLGNALAAARRRLRLDFQLLLTDGLGLTAASAARADVVHYQSRLLYEQALAGGRPADRTFCIPVGIDEAAFAAPAPREEARRALGLPATGRVLLDVAALNREHKRVDVLIREVAALGDDSILLVLGAVDDPSILAEGQAALGARFVRRDLPSASMALAYAAADVFVHAALEEGFGISVVEAMAAGLPVVVHRNAHFEWLVGDERQLADLARPRALAAALAALPEDAPARNRERARAFAWGRLAPEYVAMYERVYERSSTNDQMPSPSS